jgi:hypothetical protein
VSATGAAAVVISTSRIWHASTRRNAAAINQLSGSQAA